MRRPDASFFQTSLQTAYSAWSDLNKALNANQTIDPLDIINQFKKCAVSITEISSPLGSYTVNNDDRVKIDQILLGEEDNSESLGLEELLEKWKTELNVSQSEKASWDAMATQVKNACGALARI